MVDVIGLGHQVHHKFIVCGFNSPDAVVYCGSSNLALGGETSNGDNLIAIHDRDVATVFAIEALELVDHFNFLDQFQKPKAGSTTPATTPHPGRTAGSCPRRTSGPRSSSTPTTCGAWTASSSAEAIVFGFLRRRHREILCWRSQV